MFANPLYKGNPIKNEVKTGHNKLDTLFGKCSIMFHRGNTLSDKFYIGAQFIIEK